MKRVTKKDKIINALFIAILIIIGVICIYPIWFVIIASLSEPSQLALGKVLIWPSGFTLDGYKKLLSYPQLIRGFINSILYLFGGTFCMMAITLPAAYSLSRKELKGRRILNFLFIISMYFAGGLIPTYLVNNAIGWINTIWVMVIPTALQVYNLILARSTFESIPDALYESAQLDGASDFRFFLQFAIPLSKATIAVIFLFGALGWWNEYMRFVIYIDNPNLQSVQVVVRQITTQLQNALTSETTLSTETIMAAQRQADLLKYSIVVVVAMPFVIIYPFVQKYFNKGVMIGAVKG